MLHPRARTMLLLSIPAIVIGIAASLVLIVAMKTAAMLQKILWSNLPSSGHERQRPFLDDRYSHLHRHCRRSGRTF